MIYWYGLMYLMMALLGWAGAIDHCKDSFIKGEITPENMTRAYFDEDFTLTCSVTSASPSAARGRLYMKASSYDGSQEPRLLHHNSSGSIEMQGITIRDKLNSSYSQHARFVHYVCYYTNGTEDSDCQLTEWFIEIDHRPRAPINGTCTVYNWDYMRCVWDLVVAYRRTNISLQYNITDITIPSEEGLRGGVNYSLSGSQPWLPCPHQSQKNNVLVCEFKKGDGAKSFIPGKYFFMVKISNSTGHFVYTDLDVLTDTIVKPAKLSKLELSPNRTSIKIHMKKEKVHPVLYKIKYNSEWDKSPWFAKEKNTTKSEITLENLRPYTLYRIWVETIPLWNGKAKGYWSDPSQAKVRTLEDVPSALPEFFQGHFTCVNENCTKVILYWRPLDKIERNGVITKYNVTLVTKEAEKSEHYINRNETEINGNSSYYQVDIQSDKYTFIYVSPRTKVGYPDIEKDTIMAPLDRRPPAPADIRVESHNKTRVKVMWKPVSDSGVSKGYYKRIFAYSIYWCEFHEKKKLTCKDGIHFKVLLPYQCGADYCSTYVDSSYHETCLYGVSAEAELESGKFISSGIAWQHCSYSKSQELEHVDAKLQQQEENSFLISWKTSTCGPYVQNYVIYICQGKECDHTDENIMEIAVENNVTSYRLTDLPQSTTNRVWVVGNYSDGISPVGEPVVIVANTVPTGGSTIISESNGISVGIIVAICISVAIVAGIIVFICIKCRRYIRRTNSETRDIDLPEIKTNGMMESKLEEEAKYTTVFVKRAEDEPLLSKPNPSTGSPEQNRPKSPEKVNSRKKYSALTQLDSDRVNRDSGYASPANETQVLNNEMENQLQTNVPKPTQGTGGYVPHPLNTTSAERQTTHDSSEGNAKENASTENPTYMNNKQFVNNQPVPSSNMNSGKLKEHPFDNKSTPVNPIVTGCCNDSNNPYVPHNFNGDPVGSMTVHGNLPTEQKDTSNSTVSTISPYFQHTANFANINSENLINPLQAIDGSSNSDLQISNSQGSHSPYYHLDGNPLNTSQTNPNPVDPYVRQPGNTSGFNVNSAGASNMVPYVSQTTSTNDNSGSVSSTKPYVEAGQKSNASNQISAMNPSARPASELCSNINSSSLISPYVRQTAESSALSLGSTSSLDPYVRQAADTNSGRLNSASFVDPYVRQATDTSALTLNSASSVDPYVRQCADTRGGTLNSASSMDPYVRQVTDSSGGTLNSIDPYVGQTADVGGEIMDTSSSVDPYVRQAADTSCVTLNSANPVDPYVRQTADTSCVTLNSASSVDPYVRQAADTSGVSLNSANPMDPYVRQASDISGEIVDSTSSVDPYVRQAADTSGVSLNSANSEDPYVRQAADKSGVSLNSANSVDPYVRQTADTSDINLDSASSMDPYVGQVENTSGLAGASNTSNPINPYVTLDSISRNVNMPSIHPSSAAESPPEAGDSSSGIDNSSSSNSIGQDGGRSDSTITANSNNNDSNTSVPGNTQTAGPNDSPQTIPHNSIGHNMNQTFRTLSNGYVQSVNL